MAIINVFSLIAKVVPFRLNLDATESDGTDSKTCSQTAQNRYHNLQVTYRLSMFFIFLLLVVSSTPLPPPPMHFFVIVAAAVAGTNNATTNHIEFLGSMRLYAHNLGYFASGTQHKKPPDECMIYRKSQITVVPLLALAFLASLYVCVLFVSSIFALVLNLPRKLLHLARWIGLVSFLNWKIACNNRQIAEKRPTKNSRFIANTINGCKIKSSFDEAVLVLSFMHKNHI